MSGNGCLFLYASPALTWELEPIPESIRCSSATQREQHYFEHPVSLQMSSLRGLDDLGERYEARLKQARASLQTRLLLCHWGVPTGTLLVSLLLFLKNCGTSDLYW